MSIQRSKPFMSDYLPEQEEPTDAELAMLSGDESAADHHDEDGNYIWSEEAIAFEDWDEHDGQPDEYTEWQDYMGGDDWDHGQYDY